MSVAFDRQLRDRGYLLMGGQIVGATLVTAPKQRNTAAEKEAINAGKGAAEIWPENRSSGSLYRMVVKWDFAASPAFNAERRLLYRGMSQSTQTILRREEPGGNGDGHPQ